MASRLRVKIVTFFSSFRPSIPKRDLDTKKTTPNMDVCPESLGAMLARNYSIHSGNAFGSHTKYARASQWLILLLLRKTPMTV